MSELKAEKKEESELKMEQDKANSALPEANRALQDTLAEIVAVVSTPTRQSQAPDAPKVSPRLTAIRDAEMCMLKICKCMFLCSCCM